jgi:serralysin
LTYSIIGGADAGLFNINAATGELNFVTAPDYEIPADAGLDNIYNLTVQASDGEKTVAQEMSITVAPTNDNTPVITSTKNISVAEKTTTVATITAMDADLPAQALSYVITGGADASDFSIDKNTGTLTFITAPDYELPADSGMDNICNVVVQASDGELTVAQDIIVTITAVNDNMPVITSASNISIEENKTAVTTITAKDADLPSETLTYSISGGADASKFSINKDSGTLTFIAAPDFESPADADKNNTYEVTIKVSDGVFHISRNITITILDSIELLSPAQ